MNYRDSDWYAAIKDHPVGTRLRMAHDGCSTSEALIVTKQDSGVSAYCFRCKWSGFVGAPPESLAQKLERKSREKLASKVMKDSKALPLPKCENIAEWPLEARIWLYKAGLNNHDISEAGIYYHGGSNRVVLPVYDGPNLVYWQARGFDPEAPKYINSPCTDRSEVVAHWSGDSGLLVLVEDWLSGYRIHHATGYSTFALLGTSLHKKILARILVANASVVVWLDGDSPGQTAATKIMRQLNAYGVAAVNIVQDMDPKLLSNKNIRESLHEISLHRP